MNQKKKKKKKRMRILGACIFSDFFGEKTKRFQTAVTEKKPRTLEKDFLTSCSNLTFDEIIIFWCFF